jgi:hypothetical protein
MLRRSAILALTAVALLMSALPAASAQRRVLAEMFGASW